MAYTFIQTHMYQKLFTPRGGFNGFEIFFRCIFGIPEFCTLEEKEPKNVLL